MKIERTEEERRKLMREGLYYGDSRTPGIAMLAGLVIVAVALLLIKFL